MPVPRIAIGVTIMLVPLPAACQPTAVPRSYLALPLHDDGRPYRVPSVVRGNLCGASVMAVGTLHDRDPRDPQYASLEALYRSFAPSLILHENVTPSLPASDRESAVHRDGAIGFMQVLAAEDKVKFRSGDLPESREFEMLVAHFEPTQLLVFLTGQRLLTGLNDETVASSEYPGFYRDHLVANGFPYRASWSNWSGFLTAYRAVIGADYDPATFDSDAFSPIRNLGSLNEISRQGHRARDEYLMREIVRGASEGHRRIMVVFGAWHVLALEPVIKSGGACGPASDTSQADRL